MDDSEKSAFLQRIRTTKLLAEWRAQDPSTVFNLRGFSFYPMSWRDADLSGADLSGSRFVVGMIMNNRRYEPPEDMPVWLESIGGGHSNASSALTGADFTGSKLRGVYFDRADLRYASFSNAVLSEATFNRCRLNAADFGLAKVDGVTFLGCDLSGCVGLDEIKKPSPSPHERPVSIDVASLIATRDNLSPTFLHACGMPPTWIEYLPYLVGSLSPIQLNSCMLSHSAQDEPFCSYLDTALREKGVPVWFAPKDIKPGRRSRDQLHDAVRACDRLLLVLSKASMASNWVRNEIKWAVSKEATTKGRVLFPISLVPFEEIKTWECWDEDAGTNLAEKVRSYHVPNYGSALSDSMTFEKAVNEIVAELKGSGTPTLPSVRRT